MRRNLTYANVTATLALFVALGGGAYAVTSVGSGDIKNNSVRSLDLKNRHGVKGVDVPRNGLGGREIDERSLNATRIVQAAGAHGSVCDPASSIDYTDCVRTAFRLGQNATILAIATGGQETVGSPPAKAACAIQFDNVASSTFTPGESTVDNTDGGATNGFAHTDVSDPLPRGHHQVALSCREVDADVQIDAPTIAAIAINEPK